MLSNISIFESSCYKSILTGLISSFFSDVNLGKFTIFVIPKSLSFVLKTETTSPLDTRALLNFLD